MELTRLRLGTVNYLPVYLKNRYVHVICLGKSGTGKSTTLLNWWQQDSLYPVAKVMIEPAGFLARDAYSVSKSALYCGIGHKVSLNPMRQPYDPNVISDIIAEAINQVIKLTVEDSVKFLSPKMRAILDESVKHCLSTNRRSLVNVRDHLKTLRGDVETRDGIIQRLNFLLSDDRLNDILCGQDSVEWGELIAKGKTLIVDCSQMSKDKMVFLGNVVSQGIKNYFRYSRADYKPLALYVDECQNFVNSNFYDILKEGRKYKLSAVLATQDLATIEDKMVRIMLNVGNIVAFRLGNREAQFISREMECTTSELQFVEKYHLYYLTPEGKGLAKALPKMFIKPKPITEMKTETKIDWFPLHPYHPDETLNHPVVPVDAFGHEAETPLSTTLDG